MGVAPRTPILNDPRMACFNASSISLQNFWAQSLKMSQSLDCSLLGYFCQ